MGIRDRMKLVVPPLQIGGILGLAAGAKRNVADARDREERTFARERYRRCEAGSSKFGRSFQIRREITKFVGFQIERQRSVPIRAVEVSIYECQSQWWVEKEMAVVGLVQ